MLIWEDKMRVLGLDLGTKTLGVAVSDPQNILATPLKVINYPIGDYAYLIKAVNLIIEEYHITDIALGLPKNMDNTLGEAAKRSMAFADLLQNIAVNIHFVDERLSTVEALNILKATGNKHIKEKNVVDAVAASIILENYLKGRKNEEK